MPENLVRVGGGAEHCSVASWGCTSIAEGGLTDAHAPPACECRRHPTGALEPNELPLAVLVLVSGGRRTTSVYPLLGVCGGRCGHRCRHRIVDDAKVELLAHHRRLCTQLPFGITWGAFCARCSTESLYRSNGDSGSPHRSAGNASGLTPGFCCYLSFREALYAGCLVAGNLR